VRRAHASIATIYEFLGKYNRWLAELGADACDFALGNPQTLPLPGFVDRAPRRGDAQNPSWFAYKMSEPSSRDVVRAALRASHGSRFPARKYLHDERRHGRIARHDDRPHETGDEVIFTSTVVLLRGMVWMAGGTPVGVDVRPDTFDLDVDAIGRAITARTKYVIVNSPTIRPARSIHLRRSSASRAYSPTRAARSASRST